MGKKMKIKKKQRAGKTIMNIEMGEKKELRKKEGKGKK